MITLLKSNIVGARDVVSIMYVELLFDVKTELPDKFYQINGKNFLIANGSLAVKTFINDKNENDTIVYKYNNGKWIKTANKYTGVITSVSTIIENGKYSIGSNNIIGTNNIDVNVEGGSGNLISKTITKNGTYLAMDDDADGYSDVNADVEPYFSNITVAFPDVTAYQGQSNFVRLLSKDDGIYALDSAPKIPYIVLCRPATKIYITHTLNDARFIFTTTSDFDGIYINNDKIQPTGTTINPGSNSVYIGTVSGNPSASGVKIAAQTLPAFPGTYFSIT